MPPRNQKKIAIISGHFMPEIGYQETYLARAYKRLGFDVCVFTSTAISPTGKKIIKQNYAEGSTTDAKYGYQIQRLKATVNLNSKIIANGLADAVKEYHPDYIIILALAKLFPLKILTADFPNARKIAIFGDAGEYMDRTTRSKRFKAFFHGMVSTNLKKQLYNSAVKNCDRIILNIPETEKFFLNILDKKNISLFEKKKKNLNLGFDPDSFFFDQHERNSVRKQLKIKDDECVLITSTRVNRQKRLEEIIKTISELKSKGNKLHYIMIGFLNDDYEKELKSFISQQPHPEIFHSFGFLNHNQIRQYYSAADIGLWLKAAISIQEAMGTGLQVVLENKDVVSHLLEGGVNGWYFEKNTFKETLETAVMKLNKLGVNEKINYRMNIVEMNTKKLSYNNIAKKMIDDL